MDTRRPWQDKLIEVGRCHASDGVGDSSTDAQQIIRIDTNALSLLHQIGHAIRVVQERNGSMLLMYILDDHVMHDIGQKTALFRQPMGDELVLPG